MARPVSATSPGREALERLVQEGMSTKQIADSYEVSRYIAHYWLDKLGLIKKRAPRNRKPALKKRVRAKPRATKKAGDRKAYDWAVLDPIIERHLSNGISERAIAVGLNIRLVSLRDHLRQKKEK